jgi:hypothetical protein
MRPILISALAAALFSCTSLPPPQLATNECTNEKGPACLDETFGGPRIEPKLAVVKTDPIIRHVKTTASAKMDKPSAQSGDKLGSTARHAKAAIATKEETPSSPPVGDKSDPSTASAAKMEKASAQPADKPGPFAKSSKAAIAAKEETPSSAPRADRSDPVINRAKSTIAAKMEDPASTEFIEMKRAIRRNTLGVPLDTICGHVKGKHATGQDTGEYPFLYLIKENDAYIVDGSGDVTADAAYRNICN